MGQNSTGPPWSVTDDVRLQRASLSGPPTLGVGRPVKNNHFYYLRNPY